MRASTRSLGSIAFGSLIVTILELIRLILRAVADNANADGNRAYRIVPLVLQSLSDRCTARLCSRGRNPCVLRGVPDWVHRGRGSVVQQVRLGLLVTGERGANG